MHAHSKDTIQKIEGLRKAGYSINELVNRFSIPKTTIWHHIKNVKIDPAHIESWRSKRGGSRKRAAKNWEDAKLKAVGFITELGIKEKVLIAACLYWGEGAKREFNIINSDPSLIKVFLKCAEELGIRKDKLKITLRIYEDIDRNEAINFWAKTVGVPMKQISNVNILKGKKNGKLKYGICRIRVVKGGIYFKLIQSIIQSIKLKF